MKDLSQSRGKEIRKQRENVRTKDMASECGGEESLDGMAKASTELGIQEEGARSRGILQTVISAV